MAPETYTTVQLADEGDGVRTLRLNRPEKRNALSMRMRREISAALGALAEDESARAVILTGGGHSFCSGFDLREFQDETRHEELVRSSMDYHRDVWNFPKPLLAAVNGFAMGGGFDLAVFCDFRICSRSAVFGHPEIKFGAPPLYTPLRWIVGDGLARELCFTGRPVAADEALRIGLVSEVTPPEGLLERAVELARLVAEAPPETLLEVKAFMLANTGRDFEASFQLEHDAPFTRKYLQGK